MLLYSVLSIAAGLLSIYVQAHDTCTIDPSTIVSDACASFASLDKLNADLSAPLADALGSDFFAYYRLNLFRHCPYWNDATSICGNRACAVDTIEDEDEIPEIWRAQELSKLQGAMAEHPEPRVQRQRPKARPLQFQLGEDVDESCVYEDDDECDERDYCIPEDEGATAKGDYVSLLKNPERFTGYSGPGPRQVWDAIYKENCFSASPARLSPLSRVSEAAQSLKQVIQDYGRQHVDSEKDLYPLNDDCLEQRAFYRIISGMHASISTHLCWDYLNQTTGEWGRNLQCYKERLHSHPERVSNLYFNYALVTRALAKLRKHFEHYTFCSGDPDQDFETRQKVLELSDRAASFPTTFDESVLFQDPSMLHLKDDFKNRFRNVSRLMDCVGCDRCRLWGKMQTAGYGAALKVLFEFDETKNGEIPALRRTELVALVNTLGRISHSLDAIQNFRVAVASDDLNVLMEHTSLRPASSSDNVLHHTDHLDELGELEHEAVNLQEGWDGLEDEPYNQKMSESSISDAFWDEFDTVFRAWKYVVSSWVSFPFKVSGILLIEVQRLWYYFLGLPIPGRSWDFHFPTRDEL